MGDVEKGSGINSTLKAERIAARRARMEARLIAKQQTKDADGTESPAQRVHDDKRNKWDRKGKAQVKESGDRIEKVKSGGLYQITAVRVDGDELEAAHRLNEEQKAAARTERLAQAKKLSDEQNAAVALKWASILEKKVPQELMSALMDQKARCDETIAAKDNTIASFTNELQAHDEEYVAELQRQAKNIEMLLTTMDEQFQLLVRTYATELATIEETLEAERRELLTANSKESSELSEKRAKLEEFHMLNKHETMRSFQDQLEAKHRSNGEELNMATIQLQTSVQILRQQLEEMRAMYSLNTQKLDYNINVLGRRATENDVTIKQQKKKITVLQDQVASLKSRYTNQDKAYRADNARLTLEYKRVTEQYKELQRKFRHFQMTDAKRFKDVWDMNEEIAAQLMSRVLQADQVLNEQQLGLAWTMPPREQLFSLPRPESLTNRGMQPSPSSLFMAKAEAEAPERGPSRSSTSMRRVLDMLCNEAGFLVEDKVREVLEGVPRDQQELMRLDAIFKALGVETEADIEKLMGYFIQESADPSAEDPDLEPTVVDPNDAVRALRAFVADHRRNLGQSSALSTSLTLAREAKLKARREEKEYWQRLGTAIPERTYRVWIALEAALEKYHGLLQERTDRITGNEAIRTQNEELKLLLNQYLRQKVNEELYVPPVVTMSESLRKALS